MPANALLAMPTHRDEQPNLGGGSSLKSVEARAGIEPAHKGFADLSLTTWVPRRTWKPGLIARTGKALLAKRLERETGLEPATLALARRCSTTELLPLGYKSKSMRSGNTRSTSPTKWPGWLYQPPRTAVRALDSACPHDSRSFASDQHALDKLAIQAGFYGVSFAKAHALSLLPISFVVHAAHSRFQRLTDIIRL